MSSHDIIFALATPNGHSALHLHRLSGFGILQKLQPFLQFPKSLKSWNLEKISKEAPTTRYLILKDQSQQTIDDVVLTYYPAPKSYTGEEIVEISCHGNPYLSMHLHSFFRSLGFRDAQPGEFTQRALLFGKLDLVQAEAINQLIHAESFGSIELARNNLEGILSEETKEIRQKIIEMLAYLEAHIDFAPDEVGDYHPQGLLPAVAHIQEKLKKLYQSYENGLKIREGLKIILCGKPNAGKSSLYNGFLKEERAIVTSLPGTTRDVLEEKLFLDGKEFVLLDTAGIRETSDEVEKIGVQRTLQNVRKAHIICYLISSTKLSAEHFEAEIQKEISEFQNQASISSEQKLLIVLTKKDLIASELLIQLSKNYLVISQNEFESLKSILLQSHAQFYQSIDLKKSPILISQRQKDKITKALELLNEGHEHLVRADFPEKVASLFNGARISLEEMIGEISVDNVFEKVFSTFCIGK